MSNNKQRAGHAELKGVIGQYGIGFLSTFIIAKKVEVITKSRFDLKATTQQCIFTGQTNWSHKVYNGDLKPGTKIILYLKDEYANTERKDIKNSEDYIDLLDPQTLANAIVKFGDLLPYPIYVGEESTEDGKPLNRMIAPWEKEPESKKDYELFFERRFPYANPPIAVEKFAFNTNDHKVEASGIIYFYNPFGSIQNPLVSNQLFVRRDVHPGEFWRDSTLFLGNLCRSNCGVP